jgi:hypothetical protein
MAAVGGIMRLKAGFDAYSEVAPKILGMSTIGMQALQGRGNRAISTGEKLGYNEGDVLGMQESASRAFGKAGNQREDENRVMNMMVASRGLGLDPSQITAGGNALRAAGGTDFASKQMASMIERAFRSGMDESQASAYLSSAVGLLTQINSDGTSNTDKMLTVMTGLSKTNMSPELAARSLGGLNSAISNSSGDANAFFQGAYSRAGLGGGSMMGSMFAVRQGLNGVNIGDLTKQVGDTDAGRAGIKAITQMGLGGADFTSKAATGVLNDLHSRYSGNSQETQRAKMGFISENFGAKTVSDTVRVESLLEKLAKNGDDKNAISELTDMQKDPQEKWLSQIYSRADVTAAKTTEMAAALKNGQIDLGKSTAGYFNDLTKALIQVDGTLKNAFGLNDSTSATQSIKDSIKELYSTVSSATTAPETPSNLEIMPDEMTNFLQAIAHNTSRAATAAEKNVKPGAVPKVNR